MDLTSTLPVFFQDMTFKHRDSCAVFLSIIYKKCYSQLIRTQSTGKMDEATSKAMWQPRCGEKDILSYNELHGRRKRYTHWGECVMPAS
jgi:hypothetical protein